MSAVAYAVPRPHIIVAREQTRPYGATTSLDEELLEALAAAGKAEARILEGQSRYLAVLRDSHGHERLGFHFGDLAREVLGMDARTARNRVGLHRILASRPLIRKAFLAGGISACQVLAVRSVLNEETEVFWVGECLRKTVAELVAAVRVARAESQKPALTTGVSAMIDDADDVPCRTISFEASPLMTLAWDQALESARKVLGWEAPIYECVAAILAEAAPGDGAEPPQSPDATKSESAARGASAKPGTDAARLGRSARGRSSAAMERRARTTLTHVADMLGDLNDLLDETTPSTDPRTIVDRLKALQVLERPIGVFRGRLLTHIRETGALGRLGYRNLEEFAADYLRLSQRATRDLVRENDLFKESPALEQAFAAGRIGLRQAFLIDRLALRPLLHEFIDRAGRVTYRQFLREMRITARLSDLGLGRFVRPLPQHGLMAKLIQETAARGWPIEEIAAELARQGFDDHARWIRGGRRGACPFDDEDPAETSTTPIEIVVDLLVLATFDPDDRRSWEVRQTFSAAAATRTPAEAREQQAPLCFHRSRRIRFLAPEPIAHHWFSALHRIRSEFGPIPTWAGVAILLRRATEVWHLLDPLNAPANRKVLERDGYRCQAPGCSSRRNLQVHHIQFRSRGGDNGISNLITLCHAHHQHMLHKGAIRLRGRAPFALAWEVGCAPGRPPLWRLRGEKLQ